MKKSAEQILDQDVSDWEASTKPQKFTVPPGTYQADLVGVNFETTKNDGVIGGYTFLSVKPVEGIVLKVNRFLTSKNDREENYGIGQLWDETDILHGLLGWKPIDRSQFKNDKPGNGKRIRLALEKILEERKNLKNVTIIANAPGKSAAGKTFQTLEIGLPVSDVDGQSQADVGPSFSVGDKVQYQGKQWKITEIDDDTSIATLKLGNKTVEVGTDELLPV